MPITPESLVRHELVGLTVAVTAADNPDLLEIEGDGVMETTKTLGIERAGRSPAESRTQSGDVEHVGDESDESAGGRVYHVPKEGTTFTFALPSGEDVTVEGRRLVDRPARRTENTGDSKWR